MKNTHQYRARDQTIVENRAPAHDEALAADQRRRTRERKPRAGVEPSEEGHAKRVPERPAEHPNRLERGPPQQQRSCRSLRPTIPREEGRG